MIFNPNFSIWSEVEKVLKDYWRVMFCNQTDGEETSPMISSSSILKTFREWLLKYRTLDWFCFHNISLLWFLSVTNRFPTYKSHCTVVYAN